VTPPPEPERSQCGAQFRRCLKQLAKIERVRPLQVALASRASQKEVDRRLGVARLVQLDSTQHLFDLAERAHDGLGMPARQPVAVAFQEGRQLGVQLDQPLRRFAELLLMTELELGEPFGVTGVGIGDDRLQLLTSLEQLVQLLIQRTSPLLTRQQRRTGYLAHKAPPHFHIDVLQNCLAMLIIQFL